MAPSSSLFIVSLDELQGSVEHELAYHRRNEERWREGVRNGGRVSGIQGRQAQRDCMVQAANHKGAGDAYAKVFTWLQAIVTVDEFDEFFGSENTKLLEPWGDEAVLVLRSGGRHSAALEAKPKPGYDARVETPSTLDEHAAAQEARPEAQLIRDAADGDPGEAEEHLVLGDN